MNPKKFGRWLGVMVFAVGAACAAFTLASIAMALAPGLVTAAAAVGGFVGPWAVWFTTQ